MDSSIRIKVIRSCADIKRLPLDFYQPMNSRLQLSFMWPAVVLLGGCASIFNDSYQTLTVRTDCTRVVLNSSCSASFGDKTFNFETPARLTLPRSIEPILVSCRGGLLAGASTDVQPGLTAGFLGNAIAGGAVGAVIDLNTRRAFAYPSVTNIVMPICQFL
jgi:hypothetical protein